MWKFIVIILLLVVSTQQAWAAPQCVVDISPVEIAPGEEAPLFNFAITNLGVSNIVWIRIISPHTSIQPWTVNLGRWEIVNIGNETILKQRSIIPGDTLSFSIETTSILPELTGFNGSWTVIASENADGSDGGNCSGSMGFYVNPDAQEYTAPIISDVSISDITGSSATVNWITDELATSVVNYDVSPEADPYTFISNSDVLTSSHSLTLSASIAPETTYYFQICGTDKWGNEGCTNELSFATGVYNAPPAEVVVQTVTQTQINVQTNTVVQILRDLSPPVVTLSNKWEKYYDRAPIITGTASDNKVIVAVEYSVDRGKTWRPVTIESRKAKVGFEIDLPIQEEGDYDLVVRAYDAEGNKGASKPHTIVIDRLPPLFGATYLSWGPGLEVPSNQDRIVTMEGMPLLLTMAAVGGPIKVTIKGLDQDYSLYRDDISGRWSGELVFTSVGERRISVWGEDGAARSTSSELFPVTVLPAGRVTDEQGSPIEASVTVMIKNPVTGTFQPWDSQFYEQQNPVTVGGNGQFGLVLPSGTYYLSVKAKGYGTQQSKIFSLTESGLVRANVPMVLLSRLRLGSWGLTLPDWRKDSFEVEVAARFGKESVALAVKRELWGKPLPDMVLETELQDEVRPSEWIGQPTIVMLDAPWLPTVADSLNEFKKMSLENEKTRVVWVAAQHSGASLQGIKARSGLNTMVVFADRDAALTEYLGEHQLPVTMVMSREGVVEGIYRGVNVRK